MIAPEVRTAYNKLPVAFRQWAIKDGGYAEVDDETLPAVLAMWSDPAERLRYTKSRLQKAIDSAYLGESLSRVTQLHTLYVDLTGEHPLTWKKK